jgi:mRNA-degrading endonuclease RelE of RelBE toxin-antitoxin system
MAGVAKYSLEIKPAAAKELDALDNALFARIDRKILALAENPARRDATKTNGASASATGVSCTSLTMLLGA